ncbi:sulfatase-like hydrolase/transferase [Aeoliella mucimassa]|uniref:Sulfatase n=1 Tax=Aeoliella mucimassa TaxID=2527972 RepID=A0A518AP09_9BACT|nr:sulfatase-like hydrolase/transferase [Aeoliella mucimassa]QDU56452.1 Sulfatase [Aeoliella mucimassa]
MTNRVIIVLMVDGLRARALGAYGNTWYSTPSLDALASEATLFDRVLAESNQLGDVYDSIWTGQHRLSPATTESMHLIEQLRSEGYLCHLVTDEPELAEREDLDHFDEAIVLNPAPAEEADDVMDCGLASTLVAAADQLGEWSAEYEQPRLLWIHLRGLLSPWDAPRELAESLLGEEDPPLESSVEVPEQAVADSDEAADLVLHTAVRYAGQVMALDAAVGAVDSLVAELWPETPVEFVLAGTRGYALGEHGWLGIDAAAAHRELFQVPLIIRGSQVAAMRRESALLQSSDLYALLLELSKSGSLPTLSREQASGCTNDSRFVETNEWSYVAGWPAEGEISGELYVHPDDQWQANNVTTICTDESAVLASLLTETADK